MLPKKGIYVFYENGLPIYVGRTDRMKQRIQEHGRPSSDHNSAPFAFNLAKKAAREMGMGMDRRRIEPQSDMVFESLFSDAKSRVSNMQIRFVGIEDPIEQTLFEVYATLSLETEEFNDFANH